MSTQSTERKRAQEAAEGRLMNLGLDDAVTVLAASERQLRDGGIGVDIDVRGLSKFQMKADWYLDLAILSEDKRKNRLSRGTKRLLPDGRLQSLETRIRTWFYKHSLTVGQLGTFRYIPNESLLTWKEGHDALVADFNDVRDELADTYDDWVYDLESELREEAAETWQMLKSRGSVAEREFTERFTLTQFANACVRQAKDKLPGPGAIRRELKVEVHLATWLIDVEQARDDLAAEQARDKHRKIREENDLWARRDRAWVQQQEAKAAEAREKAAQTERIERARAAEEIRRMQIETQALQQAKMELAREAVANLKQPWLEMANQVRAQVLDSLRGIQVKMAKRETLHPKQIVAIENLLATFRMLNAAGDDELEEKLDTLATQVQGKTSDDLDNGAVSRAIANVTMVAAQAATSVTKELDSYDMFDSLTI